MATLAMRLAQALLEARLSDRGAARELRKRGVTISHAYIGQIRKGEKTNVAAPTMLAIADLLTDKLGRPVSVDWLLGRDEPSLPARHLTPEEVEQAEQARQGLEELGIRNIAERMSGLSPLSVAAIAQMVEAMRVAEAMDPEAAEAADEAWFDREDPPEEK